MPIRVTKLQLKVSIQPSVALMSRLVARSTSTSTPTSTRAESPWMAAARNDSAMPRFTVRSLAST